MRIFKKLSLRLLMLVALTGGVLLVNNDSVSAKVPCVWIYDNCMDGCEQGNGACYAACFNDYMNCILIID